MNQHRLELKNAQEARERERELAKEIVEGEMDDEDAGGISRGCEDSMQREYLLSYLSIASNRLGQTERFAPVLTQASLVALVEQLSLISTWWCCASGILARALMWLQPAACT